MYLQCLKNKVAELRTKVTQGEVSRQELAWSEGSFQWTAVLAKSDLIDKLEVVLFPSIPLRTPLVRPFDHTFRLLSEPCRAAARDPRAPPSTRRSSAFRQATEIDTGGSIALGLAMRRLERLAVQCLYRQSLDRHRLASERLSPVLGLEDPTR